MMNFSGSKKKEKKIFSPHFILLQSQYFENKKRGKIPLLTFYYMLFFEIRGVPSDV